MAPQYKFVEVAPVTEETLEAAVNEWVGKGWELEGIRFVVTEHSKRPQLAYASFTRSSDRPGPAAGEVAAPVATAAPATPPAMAGTTPRPMEAPDEAARVITAHHGDDVD